MLSWKSQGALPTWAWAYPKAAGEPEFTLSFASLSTV